MSDEELARIDEWAWDEPTVRNLLADLRASHKANHQLLEDIKQALNENDTMTNETWHQFYDIWRRGREMKPE